MNIRSSAELKKISIKDLFRDTVKTNLGNDISDNNEPRNKYDLSYSDEILLERKLNKIRKENISRIYKSICALK